MCLGSNFVIFPSMPLWNCEPVSKVTRMLTWAVCGIPSCPHLVTIYRSIVMCMRRELMREVADSVRERGASGGVTNMVATGTGGSLFRSMVGRSGLAQLERDRVGVRQCLVGPAHLAFLLDVSFPTHSPTHPPTRRSFITSPVPFSITYPAITLLVPSLLDCRLDTPLPSASP